VQAAHARLWQQPRDAVGAFQTHDAGVWKLHALDFPRCFVHTSQHAFHAEKTTFWMLHRHAGDEGAVTAA